MRSLLAPTLILAMLAVLFAVSPGRAQLPGQPIIDETDRRLHDYFDDRGCIRGTGCASPGRESLTVDHHGALYVSQDGQRYGVGWDFPDPALAAQTAIESCGNDCSRALAVTNQCLAVVDSRNNTESSVYFATSPFGVEARILAKAACRNAGRGSCQTDIQICMGEKVMPAPLTVALSNSHHSAEDDIAYLSQPFPHAALGEPQRIERAVNCMKKGDPRCLLFLVGQLARHAHRFDNAHPVLSGYGLDRVETLLGHWGKNAQDPGPFSEFGHALYAMHRDYWRDLSCPEASTYEKLATVDPALCKTLACRTDAARYLEDAELFIFDRCLKPGHHGLNARKRSEVFDLPGLKTPPPTNVPRQNVFDSDKAAATALQSFKAGNLQKAEQQMDRAIALYPTNGHLYTERCVIRRELGRHKDALRDCAMALRLPETHEDDAHVQLSSTLSHLGRHREAADQLDWFFPLKASAHYHSHRGWQRLKAGQPEQGLWDFQQALKARPRDINFLVTRALAYVLLGEEQAARIDLQKASRLDSAISVEAMIRRFQRGDF